MCTGVGLVVVRGGLFDEIDQERERKLRHFCVYTSIHISHILCMFVS